MSKHLARRHAWTNGCFQHEMEHCVLCFTFYGFSKSSEDAGHYNFCNSDHCPAGTAAHWHPRELVNEAVKQQSTHATADRPAQHRCEANGGCNRMLDEPGLCKSHRKETKRTKLKGLLHKADERSNMLALKCDDQQKRIEELERRVSPNIDIRMRFLAQAIDKLETRVLKLEARNNCEDKWMRLTPQQAENIAKHNSELKECKEHSVFQHSSE